VFSNRVIDNWNLLSANCVNCSTVNTFKKHLSSELESEAVSVVIVGIIGHYMSCACVYVSFLLARWLHLKRYICQILSTATLLRVKSLCVCAVILHYISIMSNYSNTMRNNRKPRGGSSMGARYYVHIVFFYSSTCDSIWYIIRYSIWFSVTYLNVD